MIDLSAETGMLAVTPAPAGKPGGPGLWKVKGMELPPYFQNIRNALIRSGHSPADAYRITWGAIRRWAAGGGKVHPEVRAAAAKALADLAAKSAVAHSQHASDGPAIDLAGMYTEALHPRAAGGKFGNKGGQPVAAARARNAPKTAALPAMPGVAGPMTRAQQLRYQASQDRHLAGQIMMKVAGLVRQRDAAIAGISAPKAVSPVKAAAAKKAAATRKTSVKSKQARAAAKIAAAARAGKPQQSRVQRLNGQIKLLTHDARLLAKAANHLDQQAAGL